MSDYKWLRVTSSQAMIEIPYMSEKKKFTSQKVIQTITICMISDIEIVK